MIEARLWRLYVWCCFGMRLCVNGDIVRTRNMHKYEYLMFFLTLTSGIFIFSFVSASRRRLPSLTHTHSLSLAHSHSLTYTHSHTHTLSRSLTHTLTLTLTHTHSLSLTHTLTHSHYSRTNSLMCILRGRRGTMWTAKGLDIRPGVPRAPRFLCNGVGQCA